MLACKNKTLKNLKLMVKIIITLGLNTEEISFKASDQEIDESKNWAKSLTKKPSEDLSLKSRDHINDY